MTDGAAAEPDELVARGDEALAAADWPAAKSLFTAALAQAETPEGLEGLGRASFFLDETEAMIGARERAFVLYREAGRPVDAARMATALAWDYRTVRGERALGDGWLARARRLLEGCGPTRELGWLALREASFAVPGDPTLARQRCSEVEALARELRDVDLEMTAIALDGLAQVSEGAIVAGMARLDEATTAATAGEMHDPMAIGFSCCYLIYACERVRDFERAGQWCQRLARMAEGWSIHALRSVCRAHYGTVLMLRGDWATAEIVLSESAAAQAARPAEAKDALARLAELRRRQGQTEKARALIAQTEHHPLALLSAAALALDDDDAAAAIDTANRYLRSVAEARMDRAAGLEVLVEAYTRAGNAVEAGVAAQELRALADTAGTMPLLGAARVAEGNAHVVAGRLGEAREAFEDAVQLLGQAGLPFEETRARVATATTLLELGRDDAARRELEAARERFAALGAAAEERRAAAALSARAVKGGVLTPRETEILGLVAEGLSNKEIAARLILSEHTVHRHVANILVKLRLSSRTAAAAYAAKHGLTP
jgi:LuxR family transcriptional regulator, maltose regulon positive regulatory protein